MFPFRAQQRLKTPFALHTKNGAKNGLPNVPYPFCSRGKFGRVMRCKHRDGGQYFAAKFVLYTRKVDRENVEREVEIMNSLAHPKLLYLFEAYDNARNEMCLLTE
jgi:serine/threonine protein kinase